MTDKVNPALEETANEVADRAARIGGTFQVCMSLGSRKK